MEVGPSRTAYPHPVFLRPNSERLHISVSTSSLHIVSQLPFHALMLQHTPVSCLDSDWYRFNDIQAMQQKVSVRAATLVTGEVSWLGHYTVNHCKHFSDPLR